MKLSFNNLSSFCYYEYLIYIFIHPGLFPGFYICVTKLTLHLRTITEGLFNVWYDAGKLLAFLKKGRFLVYSLYKKKT